MRHSFPGPTRRRVQPKLPLTPLAWPITSPQSKATWWRPCGGGSRTNSPWASGCENTAGGSVIGRNSVDDGQHRNMKRQTKGDGSMANLNGKVGIVTGGGTGIGRATALAMAKAGAAVVIGNRDAAKGEEVVQAIRQAGGRAVFQKTDVSKPDDVKALVETGRQRVRSAGPRPQQRRGGRPAGSAARAGHREGVVPVRREHQGRVLLHEVRDRADAQDRRRGHREHVLDLRAERLPRLVACTSPASTPSPG